MKNRVLIIALSMMLLLLVINLTAADKTTANSTDKEIQWMSYEDGIKKAKEENKHVFINFTTSWCGYCKKMKKEAFANDSVISLLNKDFVAVKVDGDSKKELDIDGYKINCPGNPFFNFLKCIFFHLYHRTLVD